MSRSWNDMVTFYRELNDVYGWNMQPMVSLVEEITASHYANGIYPITSHAALTITQNPEFNYEENLLAIEFIRGRFKFTYKEGVFAKNEWVKECDVESGFSTFEHVMKTLKWFL
jgi:hypothetical protein